MNTYQMFLVKKNKLFRVLAFIMVFSNITYQIGALVKPLPGTKQFIVNICYSCLTAVQIAVLCASFSKNNESNSNLIYWFWISMIFRNSIRIFDFEETKQIMGELKFRDLFFAQIYATYVILLIVMAFFKPHKFRVLTNFVIWLYVLLISLIVPDSYPHIVVLAVINVCYGFVFLMG